MCEAPLQLTMSVCLSVCTPLAFLYMAIFYIIHNDSLLFLGNEPSPPLHVHKHPPTPSHPLLCIFFISDRSILAQNNRIDFLKHILISITSCALQAKSFRLDWRLEIRSEIGIRYWTDYFSVFSTLKSSISCLNMKDKIFALWRC